MPISYHPWQAYPWKNELALQSERVANHCAELLLDEFDGDHNPMDMLDRAFVLAGFTIRRMFEKRLVTDKLRCTEISVRMFSSKKGEVFRLPYISHSGGSTFQNYNFGEAKMNRLTISDLANEIIHASQLMFVQGEDEIPDGLLIASDWHLKDRLLHLTIEEFSGMVKQVLDDRVLGSLDQWDFETGNIHATRE